MKFNYTCEKTDTALSSFIRFILLSVIFFTFGYLGYIKSNATNMQLVESTYFNSISDNTFFLFLKKWSSNLIFDLIVVAFSALSSMTFFCSAMLCSITTFRCTVNGICMAFLLSCNSIAISTKIIYIIYIFIFSALLSYFQMKFLEYNRIFIFKRNVNRVPNKPYFSKLLFPYLLITAKAFCLFAVLNLSICILAFYI